ncbi:MAG: YggT family protein [Chloroflexota bacterium]
MIPILVTIIRTVSQFLILLVIVSSVLSFFMSPYHPVKQALDRIVEPMLAPIRRIVPLIGMLDFSPLILIILLDLLSRALIAFLVSL